MVDVVVAGVEPLGDVVHQQGGAEFPGTAHMVVGGFVRDTLVEPFHRAGVGLLVRRQLTVEEHRTRPPAQQRVVVGVVGEAQGGKPQAVA